MNPSLTHSRIAIVGSGFAGIGMGYHLRQAGIESFAIFEKKRAVGGTWRDNTYPGCGCDIPSHLYSFSFERKYPWGWRYAKQDEILEYIGFVAKKHGVDRHIRLNCGVTAAEFDETRGLWILSLTDGSRHEAQFLITGVGQLHRPALPRIPGVERFRGKAFHSAEWDHGFDLAGRTVAVVGTGASAVQFVPEIVPKVARLHLFQRSPGWTIPKFEKAFSPFMKGLLRRFPLLHDLDRLRIYALTEFVSFAYRHAWLAPVVQWVARLHLWLQVRNPELRRKLTPDHPVGCKRILLSNDWYPALVNPKTELVTDAIAEVNETGLRTADGRQRDVDVIIYSTGFAATELLAPMKIRGRTGRELREAWKNGAEAYLGVATAGFPNLFMLYGPNTNLGSGSIIFMLEQQQRYLTQLLRMQSQYGWRSVEVRADVQAAFNREVDQRGKQTTFLAQCHSWYKTEDGRNTVNWIGSMTEYARRLREPVIAHYQTVSGVAEPARAAA